MSTKRADTTSSRKRVLYYTSSLSSGGAERQLIYTALAAEERGYEVKVVVDYPISHYDHMLDDSCIEVLCTNTTGYTPVKRFYLLSKIMREFRPDIVHSFLGMRNLWAMALGKLYGVPLKIASIRSTYAVGFKELRFYRSLADFIVCNSNLAAEIACNEHKTEREKIRVIYNAIDIQQFKDAKKMEGLKEELGIDSSVRLGVTLARFDGEKNIPGLVEALRQLHEQGFLENIHYLLIGRKSDAHLAKRVEEEISSSGLSQKITLLGFRKEVPEILKACDFMVLPSFSEGFPNVVLEAMAAGVFVISTPTGGTPEIIKDGVNGLLTNGTDSKDLVEGVLRYLSMGQAERTAICSSASKWVERFDTKHAFAPVFEMYQNLKI